MEGVLFILFIAAIVQLVLLIYFFSRLNRIAKSTSGNFFLNLFTKFHQDDTLRRVNRILEMPAGDEGVISLALNESQDLVYYLDFLEFVAALEGSEIEIDKLRSLFGKQFSHLQRHQDVYDRFIVKKRFNIEKYLQKFHPQYNVGDTDIYMPQFPQF